MTKTKLAFLVGGALAYASLGFGFGVSARQSSADVPPAQSASIQQLVWDQPPGIPPTGSGPKPKGIQQIAWEQPPGIPPTGSGPKPKRIQQLVWDQPPGIPPTGSGPKPKGIERSEVVPV